MKSIEVIEQDKTELNLGNDFSGKSRVAVFTDPAKPEVTAILDCTFAEGKGNIPAPDVSRRHYYLTEAEGACYIGGQRRAAVPGLFNCRDLGGYPTKDGGLTKWGLLYRSDALDHLGADDADYLKSMKISAVIDLRSDAEIEKNPDIPIGEKIHLALDPHAQVARQASETPVPHANKDEQKIRSLEKMAETKEGKDKLVQMQNQMTHQMHDLVMTEPAQKAYTAFLKQVKNLTPDTSLLFHCQGGKDRTGWGAALILGLLGAEKEVIYEDYLLTDIYNKPRNEGRMAIYRQYTENEFVLDFLHSLQKTKVAYMNGAFDVLEKEFGTIPLYAEKMLDFGAEDREVLRRKFLYSSEDEKTLKSLSKQKTG